MYYIICIILRHRPVKYNYYKKKLSINLLVNFIVYLDPYINITNNTERGHIIKKPTLHILPSYNTLLGILL